MIRATNVTKIINEYGDYKWPSVEEAWSHLFPSQPYKESHRAYDDAVHEAQIILALYKLGAWNPTIDV